ncbi:MAG TPA: hypothetical protein VH008_32650 [Pseudonocardia sp.]|jgi:hypothetical protein|nr:hypothetical protein [Pseudonocardia sp.]
MSVLDKIRADLAAELTSAEDLRAAGTTAARGAADLTRAFDLPYGRRNRPSCTDSGGEWPVSGVGRQ